MASGTMSPPTSAESSPRGPQIPLSLDISSLPPLINPSPPSNTLLITNLQDLSTFHPAHLFTIRELISQSAPLHSWSPLKSFRRIVVSFFSIEDAIQIRKLLDGELIMGDRVRIFFGEPTPIEPVDQHLRAPASQRLFFISPPPSPPFGWEMRNEGPPNKEVHAEDLAIALAKLHARPPAELAETNIGGSYWDREESRVHHASTKGNGSSTVVYHPQDHGDNLSLPAVIVEDVNESSPDQGNVNAGLESKIMAHTARPPLELIDAS